MTTTDQPIVGVCRDPVVLDMWHPIAALDDVTEGVVSETMLLGESVRFCRAEDGAATAWRAEMSPDDPLPVLEQYCHLWTSIGSPPSDVFAIPQHHEPDRESISAGTFGVNTSAPRSVENFLDLGHLAYVHPGLLGIEPHTEVLDYDVEVTTDPNEIIATRCRVFQPMAGPSASGAQISEYTFRVPHPYCAVLYKTSPSDPSRMDVIGIFIQAMTEEMIRAHLFVCRVDEASGRTSLRRFQQSVFGNDKTMLENQFPRRLPLDVRAETPIRADRSAITYRRWLSDLGVTYGVIPGG